MYLRTLLLPCYLQLLGLDVGERDCGDESADAAVTMLFKGNFFHWHFFASDMHFFERPSLRHLERKGCIIAFGPTAPTLFNQSACGFVVAFDCAFGFLATLLP